MSEILSNRNFYLLFITNVFVHSSRVIFLPTLPLYLTTHHFSKTEIGFTVGALALGVFLARPFAGRWTDQRGRKFSLYMGIFFHVVATPLYAFSAALPYLIGVRIIHGLGISFYSVSNMTMTTDLSNKNNRAKLLGYVELSITISVGVAAIVGLEVYHRFGLSGLLMLGGMLSIFGGILSIFISETRPSQKIDASSKSKMEFSAIPLSKLLTNRVILMASMLFFYNAVVIGGVNTFLPLHIESIPHLNVGTYFLIFSVTVIMSRLITAHWSDQYGRGPVIFYPFVLYIAALIGLSIIDSQLSLVLSAIAYALGMSLFRPALMGLLVDTTVEQNRGQVLSFFYGAFDVGIISAGLILGSVADIIGLPNMFIVTAILGSILLLIFSFLVRPHLFYSLKWTLTGKG